MMQMDLSPLQLIKVLERTISSDKNELVAAQNFLQQVAEINVYVFMQELSAVLVNDSASPVVRMAAGLQLKNQLTSNDPDIKKQYQQRWLTISVKTREYIKKNILGAFRMENNRPSSATQCVAYVAVIELAVGQWTELIQLLVNNIYSCNTTKMIKKRSLETIGYICQEIESEVLVSYMKPSYMILAAIIVGMNDSNSNVRLAATSALYNSLEFSKGNFKNETERRFIIHEVCEATKSTNTQISMIALQCLVKIMSLYYQYMKPYMANLFTITFNAIKSNIDKIALQGIEFWLTVLEQMNLLEDVCIHEALQYLVPALMQKLIKQEEFNEDWNPSKAAGVCLTLLSFYFQKAIEPFIFPFVNVNIMSPDRKYFEAALMAFGCLVYKELELNSMYNDFNSKCFDDILERMVIVNLTYSLDFRFGTFFREILHETSQIPTSFRHAVINLKNMLLICFEFVIEESGFRFCL